MEQKPYQRLEDVVTDPLFAEVDHKLRCGVHIDMEDIRFYDFLLEGAPFLEDFYAKYQCRLIHGEEGYFYLFSEGDLFGRARLSQAEMLVGQLAALMRMDPSYLKQGGRIPMDHLLSHLEMLVGEERLTRLLAPRSKGSNREKDNEKIREEVRKAIHGLNRMGFLTESRETRTFLPRKAIMRFVAPVREAGDLKEALKRLIRQGEIEVDEDEKL